MIVCVSVLVFAREREVRERGTETEVGGRGGRRH